MSEVPCNGYTLCCQRDAVRLLPADYVASGALRFRSAPHPVMPGAAQRNRHPILSQEARLAYPELTLLSLADAQ